VSNCREIVTATLSFHFGLSLFHGSSFPTSQELGEERSAIAKPCLRHLIGVFTRTNSVLLRSGMLRLRVAVCSPIDRRLVRLVRPTHGLSFIFRRESSLAHTKETDASRQPTASGSAGGNSAPCVRIQFEDGRDEERPITPTPRANPEKLGHALRPLVSVLNEDARASLSFGTKVWSIDGPFRGDAIHRHLALSSPAECSQVKSLIMTEADAMNHHPHISERSLDHDPHGLWLMTITCTTHRPRGLSMRDVRLASKINEILEPFKVLNVWEKAEEDPQRTHHVIQQLRAAMINENREKIQLAIGPQSENTKAAHDSSEKR